MKASFFEKGPTPELKYGDVLTPVIGARDVLVRVRACGVNHSDLDSWKGTSRWRFPSPWVLGAEFVGTVTEIGREVTSVNVGDLVTALLQYSCETCERCTSWRPDLCRNLKIFGTDCWGGYGEFVSVPDRAVIPLKADDPELAIAGGQCVVSTAWHMVNRLAMVRQGDIVLVPSASGGVGSALVQCAKLVGATVVATTGSMAKAEKIKTLGADEVVLRGTGDFTGALLEKTGGRGFDAVLDSASGDLFGTHLSVLRQDGALITCGAHAKENVELDVVELFQHGWRIVGFRIAPPDELRAAVDLIRNGVVKILVDRTFPMRQAAEAHSYLDQQQHVGKVLLVAE